MHQPESVLENEMLEIVWDSEIQIDHKSPGGIVNQRKNQDYTDNSIVKISWNT